MMNLRQLEFLSNLITFSYILSFFNKSINNNNFDRNDKALKYILKFGLSKFFFRKIG